MLTQLTNLRLRAIALRSSIHNEHQLSAIELTAMCAKKTNEIIDVINELSTLIENVIENGGTGTVAVKYNEATEGLQIGGEENV